MSADYPIRQRPYLVVTNACEWPLPSIHFGITTVRVVAGSSPALATAAPSSFGFKPANSRGVVFTRRSIGKQLISAVRLHLLLGRGQAERLLGSRRVAQVALKLHLAIRCRKTSV